MIIALTTLMFIALLVLTPLRAQVAFCLDLAQKTLHVKVKLFLIPVFNEKFALEGKYLDCQGTVNVKIDLTETDMDTDSGKFYMKAIIVDSLNLTIATNYLAVGPFTMVALEGIVGAVTTVACAVSNCQIHVSTQMANQSVVFGEVRLSVTLAELFLAMLREAVHKKRSSQKQQTN